MRTGIAQAPLHGGHCPPWLFEKMKQLGAAMIQVIVFEYGSAEVLRRLSDPVWFQTFGTVLGFDWHSSGLTTVLSGALKEGLQELQGELGLFLAGGKGKASKKTPEEIMNAGTRYGLSNDLAELQRTSRLVAKVDSAAVQDGYQLYHHLFIFDAQGNWAVVQQGLNENERYARRYHWLSEGLRGFVDDPHYGICGMPQSETLNLVAHENLATRNASVEISRENPDKTLKTIYQISKANSHPSSSNQLQLWDDLEGQSPSENSEPSSFQRLIMPQMHPIPSPQRLDKILYHVYEKPISDYQGLLETPGVGPATLRALAMVAEVTHGARPSFQDPVRYAFAHGGKDNYPFPVQRRDMEHSINVLKTAIEKGKIGAHEKLDALRKLAGIEKEIILPY
jgi:hypothetical protein